MRHITNYQNSSQDIVLALINHYNGTNLDQWKVDVSEPTQLLDNNVSVVVTAKPGSGFRGQKTLNYRRVNLASLTALEEVQQTFFADVGSYDEIVQKFNEKYGVNLGLEDVLIDGYEINNGAYTQIRGEPIDIIVTAKPGSKVWVGQTAFKLQAIDIWLNVAAPVTDLDGLWFINGTTPPVDPPPIDPPPIDPPPVDPPPVDPPPVDPPPTDPYVDIPVNKVVAITDSNEVRVTDQGYIRVFAI